MLRSASVALLLVACLTASPRGSWAVAKSSNSQIQSAAIRELVKDWKAGTVACVSVDHRHVSDSFLTGLSDLAPTLKHQSECRWKDGAVVSGSDPARFVDVSNVTIEGTHATAKVSDTYGNLGANGYAASFEKGADGEWKLVSLTMTWIS